MEETIILIVDFVRTSLVAQAILATASVIFLFTIWREIVALRRIRRQNRAIFASPLKSAKEVFPDGYLQQTRGIYYPSLAADEVNLNRSNR